MKKKLICFLWFGFLLGGQAQGVGPNGIARPCLLLSELDQLIAPDRCRSGVEPPWRMGMEEGVDKSPKGISKQVKDSKKRLRRDGEVTPTKTRSVGSVPAQVISRSVSGEDMAPYLAIRIFSRSLSIEGVNASNSSTSRFVSKSAQGIAVEAGVKFDDISFISRLDLVEYKFFNPRGGSILDRDQTLYSFHNTFRYHLDPFFALGGLSIVENIYHTAATNSDSTVELFKADDYLLTMGLGCDLIENQSFQLSANIRFGQIIRGLRGQFSSQGGDYWSGELSSRYSFSSFSLSFYGQLKAWENSSDIYEQSSREIEMGGAIEFFSF